TTFPGIFWVGRDSVSVSGVGPFGGGMCSSNPAAPQGQCFFGGTSAAAPHSAGCDALVRQLFGASMSPLSSNGRLGGTPKPTLTDQTTGVLAIPTAQGAGILDCYAALGPPNMTCSPATIPVDSTC